MDAFLVACAVIVAVVLMFGVTVKPYRPVFGYPELLSPDALKYSVSALSCTLESSERGYGIYTRKTVASLKKILHDLEKKRDLSDIEALLTANGKTIIDAANNSAFALRFGYRLVYARGVPRIFSLCKTLAEKTDCYIDPELAEKTLNIFTSRTTLKFSELVLFPDMLRFCLCGCILAAAERAEKAERMYLNGAADAKSGKVDLDLLESCDYVCGIMENTADADRRFLEKLSDDNGIDYSSAKVRRDFLRARYCSIISNCVESIKMSGMLSIDSMISFSKSHAALMENEIYSGSRLYDKCKILYAVERLARKNKKDEVTVARVYSSKLGSHLRRQRNNRIGLRYGLCFAVTIGVAALFGIYFGVVPSVLSAFAAFACSLALFDAIFYEVIDHRRPLPTVKERNEKPLTVRLYDILRTGGEPTKEKIIEASVYFLSSASQLCATVICAFDFSLPIFIVSITAPVTSVFVTAVRAPKYGYRELIRPFGALIEYIMLPMNTVFSLLFLVTVKFERGKNAISSVNKKLIASACQSVFGIVVLTVAAVQSSGALMITVGTFIAAGAALVFIPSIKIKIPKFKFKKSAEVKDFRPAKQIRYFGGETAYKVNLISNGRVFVSTDNRGSVSVNRNGTSRFGVKDTSGCDITEQSDGVFEQGRSVYRFLTANCEYRIEYTVPLFAESCLCRLTVINRTEKFEAVSVYPYMELKGETCDFTDVSIGKVGSTVRGAIGLFKINAEYADASSHGGGATIADVIRLEPFERKSALYALVFGKDVRDATRVAAVFGTSGYFDRALVAASAFCIYSDDNYALAARLCGRYDSDGSVADASRPTVAVTDDGGNRLDRALALKKYGYDLNAVFIDERTGGRDIFDSRRGVSVINKSVDAERAKRAADISVDTEPLNSYAVAYCEFSTELDAPDTPIAAPRTDCDDIDYTCNSGAFTENGFKVTDSRAVNVLGDADYSVCLRSDGSCVHSRENSFGSIDAFIVLSDENAIWSPTRKPLGDMACETFYRHGYTEYRCAYNGTVSRLKRYVARGMGGEVFDLTINNSADFGREIFAMFSVCGFDRTVDATAAADSVIFRNRVGGEGGRIFCSESVYDKCVFREGYFEHGKIRRTHGFRQGGICVAPTLSVRLELPPASERRVIFFLARSDGALATAKTDKSFADKILYAETALWRERLAIEPITTDIALNYAYLAAQYRTFAAADTEASDSYKAVLFCGSTLNSKDVGVSCRGISCAMRLEAAENIIKREQDVTEDDLRMLTLLSAAIRFYEKECNERAYAAIDELIKSGVIDVILSQSKCAAVISALFFSVVTQYLFGVQTFGDVARLDPHVSDNAPHIEYKIVRDGKSVTVSVAESNGTGGWQTVSEGVTFFSDRVRLDADKHIVLVRRQENTC